MSSTADNATLAPPASPGRLVRLRRALPAGRTLPEAEWRRRHRAIVIFLWANVPALAVYGLARGRSVGTVVALVGVVAVFGVLALLPSGSRRARAAAVSVGLLTATAVLIDFADGAIEAHFEFFVVIAVLTLYEDWTPFCLAIGYVALHHGIVGALAPDAVYDHRSAVDHPWGWAAIHAGFIAAAGLAAITAWRLNEDVRAENDRSLIRARESERRFKTAFDDAPMGMAIVGLDGHFLTVNRPLCEMLGRSEAWMLAHGFPDVTHPDERARDIGHLEANVAGLASRYEVEKRYMHADGHAIWIALSAVLVSDDHGEPQHFITHIQDITERRRQAAELAHRAADLERSNAELEQFAYVASHDLSEPLRTVAGFVRLLGDRCRGQLDDDADTFIEYAISGTQRMQGMIDDLLRYSRAGRPDDELVPV
ncbi:MAG TPA: PAS domain S-box protein, partial [Solirubrobacteraceae bacterium]